MAFVFACEFPEDLWYQVDMDVWLRDLGDGSLTLGMTDPAVTRSGRIVHISARVGRQAKAGQRVVTVESSKWVGPVPAPVAGTVLEVNPDVLADPNLVNRDPYARGWLVRLRPEEGPGGLAAQGLLRGEAAISPYAEKLRLTQVGCIRCAESG